MAATRTSLGAARSPYSPSARSPGPLGRRDAADPEAPGWLVGPAPGPLGLRIGGLVGSGPGAVATTTGTVGAHWLVPIRNLLGELQQLLGVSIQFSKPPPPWIPLAAKELGEKEDHHKGKQNARIIAYHATTTLHASTDETPWCSSFVNWVMEQAGYKGTNSARALSWKNWGVGLKKPALGSIGVIDWHKGGKGHVGFVVGRTKKGSIVLLGGNQHDEVRRSAFFPKWFVGFRVPKGYVVPPAAYDLPELSFKNGDFRATR